MADKLSFAVSLEDFITPHAKQAGAALQHLQTELTQSKAKLALYQQQLTQAKALGDIEGYRKYTKLVADARAETFKLGDALVKAGGPAQQMGEKIHKVVEPAEVARHALDGMSAGLRNMGSALKSGDIGGAVEGLGESLAGLASTLDLIVPGLGQVAAGAIRAAAGIAGALVEIAEEGVKTALEVAEVNEKLTETFEALGDKPGQGAKTLEFLNGLSSKLPQSRDQLAKWTREFEAFGVTDLSALRGQIEATASAQAILGDEGAASYTKLAEKIQDAVHGHHKLKMGKDVLKDIARSGVSATAVAEKLGLTLEDMDSQLKSGAIDADKFGKALESTLIEKGKGPLGAMNNELGTLWSKAKETFFHLFDGIDTSTLTDAIKSVISLGDQATPSGQQLKKGIGEGLQGIINWLGKMVTEAEVVFLTLELYAVTHTKQLKAVEHGFALVGEGILFAAHALENLLNLASGNPPEWLRKLLGFGGQAFDGATGGGGRAPAHATGGLVGRPAPGEFFASVAPGEMILPERIVRSLMGSGIGREGASTFVAANSNAGNASGGGSVHIEHLALTVQAAGGVTDATSLSVTGLTLALERLKLASGR